jgi:hypothetical protein
MEIFYKIDRIPSFVPPKADQSTIYIPHRR